ncbi:urea ABC transporter permease subunit UrtB [Phreatobacter aquaticus]|uniref:Urea ABC transporter permease subunit UrtB n=1 Tax=Phreatobacter aquaticus TaxID=2570229 RepID=A0A4D7QKV7_9HYPH|nr:urea ABC transporter permease subunit UrtB [Phreatobacter aquaticus]QCK85837.1 urea ABC transporter permease subunit UrtB [Phreatobacter aquaticus]
MRRLLLLATILIAALGIQPVRAQDNSALIQRFATENFGEIANAVTALAASGSPRAAAVIEALRDSNLVYRQGDRVVFIRQANGSFVDAIDGSPATPETTRPVRLNNNVRRAIEAAVGALSLMHPDAARRASAAEAVFKSKDATALATITKAIAQERDPRIKSLMEEARAAILVFDPSAPEAQRIDAIGVIQRRGDQDALAMLGSLPADTSPRVKEAAQNAIVAVRRSLVVWEAAQNVWYGISLGSVLLLAAIGLAITFGVMGVINMAHGEMVMIGAYTTFVVQQAIRTFLPALNDASLLVAIPLAFLVSGAIGVAIERGIIRHLYGRPLETLLATWGVSLILQQAVRSWFGPTNREVSTPSWMSGSFEIGHLAITSNRLAIIIFTGLVFAALLMVLKRTPFGLQTRAVTQNRRMAGAMGIRTNWVDAFTFGLGSGIAGLAGVALSQIDNVSPNLGQGYIIDSFMVVVFGGVGNLWGTLVGAMTLGIANKFLEPYAGAVLGKIVLLVFIILFIQKRPRGLFALKGRAVE